MSNVQTDNTMALYHALERIDELEGRCAELESVLGEAWASHCLEAVDWTDKAKAVLASSNSASWLLRKQAEAVETFAEWADPRWPKSQAIMIKDDARSHAYELRLQADELGRDG